jgi:hypothetical protein
MALVVVDRSLGAARVVGVERCSCLYRPIDGGDVSASCGDAVAACGCSRPLKAGVWGKGARPLLLALLRLAQRRLGTAWTC